MLYINIYWGSWWCPTENLYFYISWTPGSFAHIFEGVTLWCPKRAPRVIWVTTMTVFISKRHHNDSNFFIYIYICVCVCERGMRTFSFSKSTEESKYPIADGMTAVPAHSTTSDS